MSTSPSTRSKPSLPPIEMRNDIALALQQAGREATNSDGSNQCMYDALSLAIVASGITGMHYEPRLVRTRFHLCSATYFSNGPRWVEFASEPHRPGLRPEPVRVERLDVEHAFCEVTDHTGTVRILADTATWQLRRHFRESYNCAWGFSPPYFWSRGRDLPPDVAPFYSRYSANDMTPELHEALPKLHDTVEAIVARAVELLKAKGYGLPAEIYPEWFLDSAAATPSLSLPDASA